jgi:hypothetical protein
MKFKIKVKYKGTPDGSAWEEPYEKDFVKNADEAREYAEELVQNFNDTLREHERPRELVDVIIDDSTADSKANHRWTKSNLMTLEGRYGPYDEMKCEDCGITGKRYGTGGITRNRKYKAKVYARCDTAQKQLKKLEERRND